MGTIAVAATYAPPAPPLDRQRRRQEELTAQLEHVANTLVALTKRGPGKKLLLPILDCVRELRAVRMELRQAARADTPVASPVRQRDEGARAPALRPTCTPEGVHRLITSADREMATVRQQAMHDRRTCVLTCSAFVQRAVELASQTLAGTATWSVAVADVDRFAEFLEAHGRPVADALLYRVADVIQHTSTSYPGAMVGRCGDEQFGVLFPRCALPEARELAEELRASAAGTRWKCRSRTGGASFVSATLSIGVAEHHAGEGAEAVFRRALACLAQSKKAGRNTVVAAE
ncbi:GGDEF domain-containing protein [bacterium]|nr:GGDEF domain-containing protein [bacterium]